MSWNLTDGKRIFVTMHDDCPDRLRELIWCIVDIYLDAISDPYAEPDVSCDCEVDYDDV